MRPNIIIDSAAHMALSSSIEDDSNFYKNWEEKFMPNGFTARKDEKGKIIHFRWLEKNDAIDLGVPDEIVAEEGNYRDGGCQMFFSTSHSHNLIGIKERFALYLYASNMKEITLKTWRAYLKTEPQRAARDFKEVVKKINALMPPNKK